MVKIDFIFTMLQFTDIFKAFRIVNRSLSFSLRVISKIHSQQVCLITCKHSSGHVFSDNFRFRPKIYAQNVGNLLMLKQIRRQKTTAAISKFFYRFIESLLHVTKTWHEPCVYNKELYLLITPRMTVKVQLIISNISLNIVNNKIRKMKFYQN